MNGKKTLTNRNKPEAQNPLILRCHRLMEAFAKSDDERDFYIDRMEGFLIYVDLDKAQNELDILETELKANAERYCLIPKMSFYETKKIMEGFVNEKVYDIDTKEKLLDIIQSKEARENFLEFIYDHHAEQEKWQQFYQERSRIRIIEWLRQNHFHFVFEEDLDLPRQILEKLKQSLFDPKVGKDLLNARKALVTKAKTYYSNEALNPRPKRGRPPKQAVKPEIEPQVTTDIFTTVHPSTRPFLFTPELQTSLTFSAFSSKFESEGVNRRLNLEEQEASLEQKLASLRTLSSRWVEPEPTKTKAPYTIDKADNFDDEEDEEDEEDDEDEYFTEKTPKNNSKSKTSPKPTPEPKNNTKTSPKPVKKIIKPKPVIVTKKAASKEKEKPKRIIPQDKPKKAVKRIIPKEDPKKSKGRHIIKVEPKKASKTLKKTAPNNKSRKR